jgi:hypothetical protein
VVEHLAEITAIDPAIAARTSDEMLGLVRGLLAGGPAENGRLEGS